ncbi:9163_t:CDS:2 [Ambispora gerdemannii]|uniref:glucan endo-1,3-beta-D-glucosidase n=1 Tax=Ambispora gerdemannii TaxID=144530 RepID=A0A9N9F7G0_9GLOM|nr:9163_t:CDS:2 [Ambispora gerdemannii]
MVDPNASEWLKKQQRASRKTRLIVSTVGILVIIAVVAGVVYALMHKGTSGGGNSGSRGNSDGFSGGNSGVGGGKGANLPSNPDGPYYTNDGKPVNLTITPDPRLHKSFYGINYGPILALFPWCTNTLGDTIEDLKVLSQLTNRLRLYGMDCNMLNFTVQAIDLLKLDMTVVPTVWVDGNETTYTRQYNDLFNNLDQHGISRIEGVSVGNEAIFRKQVTIDNLNSRIADVRNKIKAKYPNANTPVFTSDIGSNVDKAFVAGSDVIFANVHPYFGGVSVNIGATWTFDFFQNFDVKPAAEAGKPAVISEIGWPTNGTSERDAVASVDNLQTFLDTYVCTANTKQTKYYYFEAFDTPWKKAYFTVLEGSWGLFNPDRSFKPGIKLPDCQVTAGGITSTT